MALNPYFNFSGDSVEQQLIKDLHRESIEIHGLLFYYIPRTLVKEDTLFHEDIMSSFDTHYEIEGYVDSFENYGGMNLDFVSEMGLTIDDEINITVSQDAFRQLTGMDMPKEGDLIYWDIGKALFEIRFNEDELQFYPLGTQVSFKLKCVLFKYNQNDLNTGIDEVDAMQDDYDPTVGGEDSFGDNLFIETEADAVLDFDETSPFGNY